MVIKKLHFTISPKRRENKLINYEILIRLEFFVLNGLIAYEIYAGIKSIY